ncbi:hypothetical protein [Paraburkholderia unamae]|uniref:hypothetical protein n=1 Tax=Paraburkholderia unamae TaxID=219649 RepID=UPI000DD48B10|nr:hypothetical protein [Paraburkholderia unamae]
MCFATTAVLPLPWAALAMIAQRKPNNDKGFEDFAPVLRVFLGMQMFLGCSPLQIPPARTISDSRALRRANAA